MAAGRRRILSVGLICLDIVNVCDNFPKEDQDVRALDQRWQRGGNAANQAEILAQLGMDVEFLGSLSDGQGSEFAVDTLNTRGVKTDNCTLHKGFGFPTSCVTLSLDTGSRTIVHYRPVHFPEVSSKEFKSLDLGCYHWVHFEVRRNLREILEMIAVVESFNKTRNPSEKITISIEIEKKYKLSDIVSLLNGADLAIVSRELAEFLGYASASSAVHGLKNQIKPNTMLVCPWGSLGADGADVKGILYHSDSYPPGHVKDTLGAGDTFIAGLIRSLYDGKGMQDALISSCKLAGFKCGVDGYDQLGSFWHKSINCE